MPEPIHVALGIHDPSGNYSCHAGAMLASLFLTARSPICAHVVHNETLTHENKRRLAAIGQRFGKEIRFHPVQLPVAVCSLGGHVTQGALFRLLLPELVVAAKIIYFDCDIIVNLDIGRLWELDLQDRPIAAVLDPGIPTFPDKILQRIQNTGVSLLAYFNSGVVVLNLDCLRRNYQLFNQATAYLKRWPELVFPDQDALNWLFQQNYLQLDSRFNKIVSRSGVEELRQPAIWHFAGVKPWEYYDSPLDMLYWQALALTPWQDKLFEGLAKAIDTSFGKLFEQINKDKPVAK